MYRGRGKASEAFTGSSSTNLTFIFMGLPPLVMGSMAVLLPTSILVLGVGDAKQASLENSERLELFSMLVWECVCIYSVLVVRLRSRKLPSSRIIELTSLMNEYKSQSSTPIILFLVAYFLATGQVLAKRRKSVSGQVDTSLCNLHHSMVEFGKI